MSTRRTFLASAGITGLMGATFRQDAVARAAGADRDAGACKACELAGNEDFWSEIGALSTTIAPSSTSTTAVFARRQPMSSIR